MQNLHFRRGKDWGYVFLFITVIPLFYFFFYIVVRIADIPTEYIIYYLTPLGAADLSEGEL